MGNSLKKLVVCCLICVAANAGIMAQTNLINLDATSFRPVQGDVLTGVAVDKIEKDRSNRACFRLKIKTAMMPPDEVKDVSVVPIGGNIVVMSKEVSYNRDGIIVVMTAKSGIRLYLHHDKYGDSNIVTISPEPNKEYYIESRLEQKIPITVSCKRDGASVFLDGMYRADVKEGIAIIGDVDLGKHILNVQDGEAVSELDIEVAKNKVYFEVELSDASSFQQFVVFKVSPADAVVEFDGDILEVSGGTAQKFVRFGTYSYKVEAYNHHSATGTVTVNDLKDKHVVSVNLAPAYGYLKVTGGKDMEGASVYIDNRLVGKIPCISEELPSGKHTVKVSQAKYETFVTTVEIEDGITKTISPDMNAKFANITLKTDSGAEIWVNGEKRGIGMWSGELPAGTYRFEARKENHSASTLSMDITSSNSGETVVIPSPVPQLGSVMFTTDPALADLEIDGRNYGQTPVRIESIIAGSHQAKVSLPGYGERHLTFEVSEGKTTEVEVKLVNSAKVRIVCNAPKADLYVDGNCIGKAWGIVEMPVGKHKVRLTAAGFKDYESSVELNAGGDEPVRMEFCLAPEDKVFDVNGVSFKMIGIQAGKFVNSRGQSVYLDSYYMGETEVTEELHAAIYGRKVRKDGKKPAYKYSVDWNKLHKLTGESFCFPSENRWEYAAMGGHLSKNYKYSGSNNIGKVAWFSNNSSNSIKDVKKKLPNELGLYDMSGNLAEYCGTVDGHEVYRGGDFKSPASECTISAREVVSYGKIPGQHGMRLCLSFNPLIEKAEKYSIYPSASGDMFEIFFDTGESLVMRKIDAGVVDKGKGYYGYYKYYVGPYYMAETEITEGIWVSVMGGSVRRSKKDFPKIKVTREEVNEFIARLNRMTGLDMHLPDETQWVYAGHGPSLYKPIEYNDAFDNYIKSLKDPVEVKKGVPNYAGLYDMDGNAFEMFDGWLKKWPHIVSKSELPNGTNPKEYHRGLIHYNYGTDIVSYGHGNLGFRLAMTVDVEPQEQVEVHVEDYEVNGVTFRMVEVEGGVYDRLLDKKYDVSSFSIGETEVTEELWLAVMGKPLKASWTGTADMPVKGMKYKECLTFIKKLNKLTGKTFSLPDNLQWEYAASGGKYSRGCCYSGTCLPAKVFKSGKVRTSIPNELRIYDMSGNVGEFISEISYSKEPYYKGTGAIPERESYGKKSSVAVGFRLCLVK